MASRLYVSGEPVELDNPYWITMFWIITPHHSFRQQEISDKFCAILGKKSELFYLLTRLQKASSISLKSKFDAWN
jgi:hypothetical protein